MYFDLGADGKIIKKNKKICTETLNLSILLFDDSFYLQFTSKLTQ
jgi:hypothetical protein